MGILQDNGQMTKNKLMNFTIVIIKKVKMKTNMNYYQIFISKNNQHKKMQF